MFKDYTGKTLVLLIQHHAPPYNDETSVIFVKSKKEANKKYQEFIKEMDIKLVLFYNKIVDGIAETKPEIWIERK